jgi:hypothetical protein
MAAKPEEKPYNDGHVKMYNKLSNMEVMPIEKHIEFNELYDSARIDGLSALKGKRVKDYEHAVDLLTDALLKFRKSSKHPHASEDPEHRHFYAGEVRAFLEQYARSNKMSLDKLEKEIKRGKLRGILETYMDTEQQSMLESKIDNEFRKVLKRDNDSVKGVAEYHLEQNPHMKKAMSKKELAMFKNDYESLLQALKGHYMQNLENKLNDYTVPDKKEDDKKKK